MDIDQALGLALREIRRKTAGTQEEFSRVTGISQTHVSGLERGKGWGLATVAAGLERAGVDPLDLLRLSATQAELDPDLAEITTTWQLVEPGVRQAILTLVRSRADLSSRRRA